MRDKSTCYIFSNNSISVRDLLQFSVISRKCKKQFLTVTVCIETNSSAVSMLQKSYGCKLCKYNSKINMDLNRLLLIIYYHRNLLDNSVHSVWSNWLRMTIFLLLSEKVTRKNWVLIQIYLSFFSFYLDDLGHLALLLFIRCRSSKDLMQ